MMKPPIETVRISQQGKEQLMKLRRHTGIENWNALARWALCASLRDPKAPPPYADRLEGGVEMTWKVFAGDQSDIYAGLIRTRAPQDGFGESDDDIGKCLRAHLHRGLGFLTSGTSTRSIADLVDRWILSSGQQPPSSSGRAVRVSSGASVRRRHNG